MVDGYHFDSEYQRCLKNAGLKLLFVDDCGQCGHYFADLVLDQNAPASDRMYANCESYTEFLTGPRFTMLRREFRRWPHGQREIPDSARKLLVTIGGSDPDKLTLRLIKALAKISRLDFEVTVVVGGSNPDLPEVRRAAAAVDAPVNLISNANNMPELMSQSDLAIICAGGTLWELLYMGCPTLSYSRNRVQARIIAELDAGGVVRNMGSVEDFEENAIAVAVEELAASRDCRGKNGCAWERTGGWRRRHSHPATPGAGRRGMSVGCTLVPVEIEEREEFLAMAEQHFRELNPAFAPAHDWQSSYFETIKGNANYLLRWILVDGQRAGFIISGSGATPLSAAQDWSDLRTLCGSWAAQEGHCARLCGTSD